MNHRIILPFACLLSTLAMFTSCKEESGVEPVPVDYTLIDTIRYTQHVQPILSRSCAIDCHDGATKVAGLQLTSWNDLILGSAFGEVVIPAKPSRSLLTSLFDGTPHRKQHPDIGTRRLTHPELTFLKRWITSGARNDPGAIPYTGSTHRLYVPNQGEDNVAIIDVDQLLVTRYIDVGRSSLVEGPHFVAANRNYWYVSLIGAGEVWKFDARTDTLAGIARVPGAPALLALTPDGSKLYASQFATTSTNRVTVIETEGMTVVSSVPVWNMPHGIRMNNAGSRVYVANMMSDNISVIDVATDEVVETILLAHDARPGGPARYMPMEIAISPDDRFMMVTCSENREARLFDLSTLALIDSFRVGDQPWHLQFTADGSYCYVANRRGNTISAIHMPMRMVMETLSTPTPGALDYPHGVDVSAARNLVFVSNENGYHRFLPRYNLDFTGNVTVIDRNLNSIVKVIEVGKLPTGISISE